MPLSILVIDFLQYQKLERKASKLTIRNYNHYLKKFILFAGDIKPEDIDLHLVKRYRLHLLKWLDPKSEKPLKKVTQNYFMIALRTFLNYLSLKNINTLASEEIKLGETEQRSFKVLDEAQLKQLLEAPDLTEIGGLRDRAILETLFSTGLLVSELVSLNKDIINLQGKEFVIIGKGDKKRVVFLSDSAVGYLYKYLSCRKDTFKPLFIRFQGKINPENDGESMRLTPRSIERIVEKYVKALNLPTKATPHTLRHGFAADLLNNGVDIQSIQEMLGHTSVSSTQVYAQTILSTKQERV